MKTVRFLEKCAGREKGVVEVVNDGNAAIWASKGAEILEEEPPSTSPPPSSPTDNEEGGGSGGGENGREEATAEIEEEKEQGGSGKGKKSKDLEGPKVTRHFAGAPLRK